MFQNTMIPNPVAAIPSVQQPSFVSQISASMVYGQGREEERFGAIGKALNLGFILDI